jgi:hypothetical protein
MYLVLAETDVFMTGIWILFYIGKRICVSCTFIPDCDVEHIVYES